MHAKNKQIISFLIVLVYLIKRVIFGRVAQMTVNQKMEKIIFLHLSQTKFFLSKKEFIVK